MNRVRAILEDREGVLWVGTSRGGLNLFIDTTGTFRHFRHDPNDPHSLSQGQVPSVLEDDTRDGHVPHCDFNRLSFKQDLSSGFLDGIHQGIA